MMTNLLHRFREINSRFDMRYFIDSSIVAAENDEDRVIAALVFQFQKVLKKTYYSIDKVLKKIYILKQKVLK